MFINNFDPVAFNFFILEIRWYSLSYIFGILFGWFYIKKFFFKDVNSKSLFDNYITYIILGIIIGGRIGYVLFYNLNYYLSRPQEIFFIWEGGMSFHGGLIGVMLMMYLFSKKYGFKFFQITDWVAPSIPIALFFGRIANFINAELYGRATNVSWGMIFPSDPEGIVRHPSQLYEAALEGIALFVFLNLISKDQKSYGRHSAYFLIGYGLTRSLAEFFRVPDYVYGNDFLLFSFLTQGQLLCIPMIIFGVLILIKNNARLSRPT